MIPFYEEAVEEFLNQFEKVDEEHQKVWDEALQAMNKQFEESLPEFINDEKKRNSKIAEMARKIFLK